MLKKIPPAQSRQKVSNDNECFKIKEHIRVASRIKVLEFKEKSSGLTEKDGLALTLKFAQKQSQIMREITFIMEKNTAMESSSVDFEGLHKSVLFISRDLISMEALTKSIEGFAESYPFVEFESL